MWRDTLGWFERQCYITVLLSNNLDLPLPKYDPCLCNTFGVENNNRAESPGVIHSDLPSLVWWLGLASSVEHMGLGS